MIVVMFRYLYFSKLYSIKDVRETMKKWNKNIVKLIMYFVVISKLCFIFEKSV